MGVRKMSLEEQQEEQKVTNHYRVEITEFQEDSQDSEYEAGRIVHWPPPPASSAKEGEFVQKLEQRRQNYGGKILKVQHGGRTAATAIEISLSFRPFSTWKNERIGSLQSYRQLPTHNTTR